MNAVRRLEARGVKVAFAGVVALDQVDVYLAEGTILGLIGPNGAGKTTMIDVLSGFRAPTAGDVFLGGDPITSLAPHNLARRGVARTFQGGRLFGGLTVRENVEAAALCRHRSRRAARRDAHDIVERTGLDARAASPANALSHGDERRLALGRALAMGPRFLLLDEPAAGLAESETDELVDTLREVRAHYRCGILVVEHDMRLILNLCDRIQVLAHGKTICTGEPQAVQHNKAVIDAYLGAEAIAADAEA